MAQQTQIATMLPYFERFLKAFPTVVDLAKAPESEVLKLWAGLGYYSRARNLHKGAQAIAARMEQGLGFPKNAGEWIEIPGVGPYTAGSISSIVHNERAPIVDGNVVRVLSRVYAIEKISSDRKEIWEKSEKLVKHPEAEPRVLNQALMELGALVCRPKNPTCLLCPIQTSCEGKTSPISYPAPKPKTKWKRVSESKWIILRREGKEIFVLLNSGDDQRWRKGLYDFPDAGQVPLKKAAKLMGEFTDAHVVTHHKIKRTHQVFWVNEKKVAGEWFQLSVLPGVSAPVKRALDRVLTLERAKPSRSL